MSGGVHRPQGILSLPSSTPTVVANLEWHINMLLDLMQAHDSVHPDKGECGGVGGCLMMRAENEAEETISATMRLVAKTGRIRIETKA